MGTDNREVKVLTPELVIDVFRAKRTGLYKQELHTVPQIRARAKIGKESLGDYSTDEYEAAYQKQRDIAAVCKTRLRLNESGINMIRVKVKGAMAQYGFTSIDALIYNSLFRDKEQRRIAIENHKMRNNLAKSLGYDLPSNFSIDSPDI